MDLRLVIEIVINYRFIYTKYFDHGINLHNVNFDPFEGIADTNMIELLYYGTDPWLPNQEGLNAYEYALAGGHDESLNLLNHILMILIIFNIILNINYTTKH